MNLCSDGHEEVCYNHRNCPVCEANFEIGEANERIDQLLDEIEELKKELRNETN